MYEAEELSALVSMLCHTILKISGIINTFGQSRVQLGANFIDLLLHAIFLLV